MVIIETFEDFDWDGDFKSVRTLSRVSSHRIFPLQSNFRVYENIKRKNINDSSRQVAWWKKMVLFRF